VQAQAHVTHNNAVSDAVCQFLTLAVQDLLRGCSLAETLSRPPGLIAGGTSRTVVPRPPSPREPSGWVVETLQAVLQGLDDSDGFEDCLVDVVNRGGDADTTGAIAGMLAGALYGLQAIPKRWLAALDPGVASRCREQARSLLPVTA
jgi:ADP-ribosyl-[dinitrogen reductase] hydrolase